MSVLVKGMEMPTSCGYCPFKYRTMEGDECMFDVAYTTYQSRPDDCPLIPVPDYGQLIDADKAIENIMIRQYALKDRTGNVDSGLFTRDIERCIKEQPTLSPADVRPVVLGEKGEVSGMFDDMREKS